MKVQIRFYFSSAIRAYTPLRLDYPVAVIAGGDKRMLAKRAILEIQAYGFTAIGTNCVQFRLLIHRPQDLFYCG